MRLDRVEPPLQGARTGLTFLAVVLASLLIGGAAADIRPSSEATIGVSAMILCLVFAFAGRRDLSRPGVALPIIWYAGVSISQLKLLHGYETSWSQTTTFLVFAGPLFFAAGSAICSFGIARPKSGLKLDLLRVDRLQSSALILLGLGVGGLYLKTQATGGIPLLSSNIDSLRSAGGIKIHAWITMLTDCFYLSAWMWMLSAIRSRGWLRIRAGIMIVVALVGVAFGASRNTLLVAVFVPIVFAYISGATRNIRSSTAFGVVAGMVTLLLIVSGLFFVRTGQHEGAVFETYFYREVVPATDSTLRPLLPVYVGLATPLETLNRVVREFSSTAPVSHGTYSAPGIPPEISPFGPRSDFYQVTGELSRPYYFNVATYEGTLFADGGVLLVLTVSFILGLGFSWVRRKLLANPTVMTVGFAAYITYLSVFLVYENVLAFYTLSVITDLVIMMLTLRYCTRETIRD
jgi:oligosaccharide repeat unit polymerase